MKVYPPVRGIVTEDKKWTLYCTTCGRELLKGVTIRFFASWCDCNWRCCEAAMPPNKMHGSHMAYRPEVVD